MAATREKKRLRTDNDVASDAPAVVQDRHQAAGPVVVSELDVIRRLLLEEMQSDNDDTVDSAFSELSERTSLVDAAGECGECTLENNIKHFYRLGGHGIVMYTMTGKWRKNEMLQIRHCRCINEVVVGGHAKWKATFLAMGAMEAIVTAMRTFSDSCNMQCEGCRTLEILLAEAPGTEHAERFVNELDGLSLIMQCAKDDLSLLDIAFLTLGHLAKCENLKKPIIQAGAVVVAGKALTEYPDDKDVQESATRLLHLLFRAFP